MEERLQKILARAGIASRRAAEQLILAGRVQVDGRTITQLGYKADPDQVSIRVDGKKISAEQKVYLLLNKPAGYVTTLSDPQGRKTVAELVRNIPARLFPVGRLDLDTEGALIMTNDGAFAHTILHPSHEIKRTYEALVNGLPSRNTLRQLSTGIELDDFVTAPAKLRLLRREAKSSLVEIIIHEGKKRQVRRMFQAVGHRVLHLRRIAYGNLRLNNLPLGHYKMLSPADREQIFS
ncbi:MAG: rRNA pseudouridine synthase [Desulfobulbaceae bacterium]|nr:rRNA pseudouridine synthase [Desulfobulbaceae bacterium]